MNLIIILNVFFNLFVSNLNAETIRVNGIKEITELPKEFLPHLMTHCEIFNRRGQLIMQLPFNKCQFADDGSYVAGTNDTLYFYNQKLEQTSKQEIKPHHDIFKTKNGDYLVLGSKYEFIESKNIRFDVLYRFSSQGNLVGKFEFNSLFFNDLKKSNKNLNIKLTAASWLLDLGKNYYEYSHANSAYEEINGNIVVYLGVLKFAAFINSNLTKLENLKHIAVYTLHDLQPTKGDNFLSYINKQNKDSKESKLVLLSGKSFEEIKKWEFINPDFYSEFCGSIQLVGNRYFLFSEYIDSEARVDIFDQQENKRFYLKMPDLNRAKRQPIQSIKNIDLTKFLANNRKL